MKLSLLHIVRRSLSHGKTGLLYLVLIILILTAVITGSILTGGSVRKSLRDTSVRKLGNTGIVVSTVNRYFDPSLAGRLKERLGINCTGILEINGYCQNFQTGQTALGVKILGIDHSFFDFQNSAGIEIRKGEAVINEKLAEFLGLKSGDDIIIRFKPISDIPSDAPFAPDEGNPGSIVLKTGRILPPDSTGNFSLGISQIPPLNVFINRDELTDTRGRIPKINRILISSNTEPDPPQVSQLLGEILRPEDIGLTIRHVPKTGGSELISDRIFIDQPLLEEIRKALPSSLPIITYLGNNYEVNGRSAPYSFISALPKELYPEIPGGNGIIINRWLAKDLSAKEGDSIRIAWYSPNPLNRLEERSGIFKVSGITDISGVWSDSLLMPEFPGIAGKESCSDWDAGVSIRMDRIRDKDEEYWKMYRGTPKAFIDYSTGIKLWGSNFGPATAVRFPAGISEDEIRTKLTGSLNPDKSGFSVINLRDASIKAAAESVDFSTLFLSLGFFIILSAGALLILVVSGFYDSKKGEISTLVALGFTDRWIRKLIFIESGIIALAGTAAGAFTGLLFNVLIIRALNSVWQGAVQTDTLSSAFEPVSILYGFLISFAVILIIVGIKSHSLLKNKNRTLTHRLPSVGKNNRILIGFLVLTICLIIFSLIFTGNSMIFSFIAGIAVFFSFVLSSRRRYLRSTYADTGSFQRTDQLSSRYYAFNSSQAIVPMVFLAAGLFAVIITGFNRMSISEGMLKPEGGTGGYALWGETALPVPENLNSPEGRKKEGLDEPDLRDLSFVQASKLAGDDASCLNLNHVTSPPLLGLDPSAFVRKGAFSFATRIKSNAEGNPWSFLSIIQDDKTIYGIADQTVLQYGLKIRTGDTLFLRSESGRIINVVIAAGLKSSIFQGYVLISRDNMNRYFPSVSGSQVFLAEWDKSLTPELINTLTDRLSQYGAHFEPAGNRLSQFFVVTNTYLKVFSILGGLGLIMGVVGLGFILLRNFNQRKREFGLLMASGFSLKKIKGMILKEQLRILISGVVTGSISAFIATLPSLANNPEIPWKSVLIMIILIIATGLTALTLTLRSVSGQALIASIRKE
ncbi:MAG: FtsX-like permease family protein [Bacteroidota bacterium]|nr:FtsX-like permease family protein [Bacteroidota bacterium]